MIEMISILKFTRFWAEAVGGTSEICLFHRNFTSSELSEGVKSSTFLESCRICHTTMPDFPVFPVKSLSYTDLWM
jgi:hypothetical protein